MKSPKSIKLFLMDGTSDGRMICELSNWSGKAIKIPRILLKESNNRTELKGTGVYFLFGRNEDDTNSIYIGEAEDIFQRLLQHQNSKDFWNEAIVFTSKDENLNKAHIKYLEHRLYQIALKTKRYSLINANTPNKPAISEVDQAEMEEFITNILMTVPVLGHKVFDEIVKTKVENKNLLYLTGPRGANAKGTLTSEGFVVLKDSIIASDVVSSFTSGNKKLRDKLLNDKTINKSFVFTEDFIFSSPSAAAVIVLGRPANGLIEWKKKR
jgi:predicted GIY-YIG superfamily endonuclease